MDWWDVDFCTRLADGGRHVVRYDHRDTGRSTTGPAGSPAYTGAGLRDDCRGLVEALDLGPVHLVGISMGGAMAQAVALQRPDLVATLTVQSTTPIGRVEAALPGPAEQVSAAFASPLPEPDWSDARSYADWVLAGQLPFLGSIPLDHERILGIAATIHARSHDVAAAGNHWLAVAGADDESFDVRRITAPTLVVHGSDDPFFPLAHGEALAAAVPDADLLVVPGMGHEVPPPETWDLVIPALLAI
jgi:pimeloyl-ACP methyl ester carboxylesterase